MKPPTKKKKNNKLSVVEGLKKILTEMYNNLHWNTDPFDDIEDEEDIEYLNSLIKIASMYKSDPETADALQHIFTGINDGGINARKFMDFMENDPMIAELR
jgi:hypothetical protein